MSIKRIFLLLQCFFYFNAFSQQIVYATLAPDSVKKKCDEVVISEIGKNAFNNDVKFIKADLLKGGGNDKYTIFYSFTFPNVKESHVVFSLDYKPGKGVVKDAAFKNYTRLPKSIKTKGVKIIDYNRAKNAAMAADSMIMHNSTNVYGELSTEYDEKKKDYYFVWYFYSIVPCKDCKDRPFSLSSVYIDATSGQLLTKPSGQAFR
jgi:hypothetical protein